MILDNDPEIESFRSFFEESATRWSETIVGDLPDFPNNNNGDLFKGELSFQYTGAVDDVVIGAEFVNIANLPCGDNCACNNADVISYCSGSRTIGRGGVATAQRFNSDSTTLNTVAGYIQIERTNFVCCATDTSRRLVILHEIGHALGVGIYDSTGFESDNGSFQETCNNDPAVNNVLSVYPFWPSPPTPVDYWNAIDPLYKTNYKGGEASMEDCALATESCGGCGHWEIEMFPSNPPGDFQRSQEMMVYLSRSNWAQVITGLSLGTLKDVGYDDGVNVRVDLSKADPYPTPNSFSNRGGGDKVLIADQDIDWEQMLDGPPPTVVERTR